MMKRKGVEVYFNLSPSFPFLLLSPSLSLFPILKDQGITHPEMMTGSVSWEDREFTSWRVISRRSDKGREWERMKVSRKWKEGRWGSDQQTREHRHACNYVLSTLNPLPVTWKESKLSQVSLKCCKNLSFSLFISSFNLTCVNNPCLIQEGPFSCHLFMTREEQQERGSFLRKFSLLFHVRFLNHVRSCRREIERKRKRGG